ncbi:MAG: DMT family transporter, partial [Arenicellales bacterium]
ILAIAVSFIGVVIIATHGNVFSMQFSNPLGVSLALVSTVVWASYWLISQTDQQDSLLRLWVNFIAGVVWMALLMSFTHSWVMPPTSALMGAAYIGLFEMSLAFYCWFQALRLSDNIGLMNNLIFLTPFGSLMVIALVLKEPIHVSTVLGLGLICASILIQRYLAARVAAREKAHHDII